MNSLSTKPAILKRYDGMTIAYHRTRGKSPGVVFLPGLKSDMNGAKALAIESLCKQLGHRCLRFDYFGHGQSSGNFEDGTIGRWADDAIAVIDQLTTGPQVLVGSSLGGWVMLLAARARPKCIAGLLGISAAPDFTEDLILQTFTSEQHAHMANHGYVDIPNCHGEEPYRISQELLDEGRNNLLLRNLINIDMPVRLIHGLTDRDVPWRTSVCMAEKLTSNDVELTLVKNGDHRLSEDSDLKRLQRSLATLLADLS